MKIHVLEAGLVATLVARAAWAQPADPANPPGPPSGAPNETVLPAEPVAPARPPAAADQPITVDQIIIASTERIDLNFFGDVSLRKVTDQELGFAVGPIGFQVAAHLAAGLVGRTEFAMELGEGETVVDVERAYLEYRTAHWAFTAGRTHAELGYWNNAFHHGRWLQLTIDRPRVLRFEDDGGLLPVHQIGVTAAYGPRRGNAGLELAVGVGNGHGRVLEAIQNVGDNNKAKSVLARLGLVGIGHPGLHIGVNFGFDVIAPEPMEVRPLAPGAEILELITGAYLALRSEHLIVYSEGYNLVHRAMGTTWQITDGFFLAGVRVGKFIPYGQIELRRGDGAVDPYFHPDASLNSETLVPLDFTEGIAGIHYDLGTWSALKLELAARRQSGADDYRVELNWSFGR
ncbi:MAG TPA: hypothetical protein VGD80_26155 [Kofleriaceae bacterium]